METTKTHTDRARQASARIANDLRACYSHHGAMSRFSSGELNHLISLGETYVQQRDLANELEDAGFNGYSYGRQSLAKWRKLRKAAQRREAREAAAE